MQWLGQVQEGCSAHTPQVSFRKVPVQRLGEVPEGLRSRKVLVQMLRSGSGRLRCRYPGQDPEGSGTEVI